MEPKGSVMSTVKIKLKRIKSFDQNSTEPGHEKEKTAQTIRR